MMNNAIFTDEMLSVLAEMKGKTFKSYECVKMGTSMMNGVTMEMITRRLKELKKFFR